MSMDPPSKFASIYVMKKAVPANLQIVYEKTLPFHQGMVGTANIVIEDQRILVQVFDQLNGILRKGRVLFFIFNTCIFLEKRLHTSAITTLIYSY